MAIADKGSAQMPPSEWFSFFAASVRLGLSPSTIAVRARRRGWPMRMRSDTGEPEVEIPGFILAARNVAVDSASEEAFHLRVAQAVSQVDRFEATQTREKANAEERAATIASAFAKRPWWRLGR